MNEDSQYNCLITDTLLKVFSLVATPRLLAVVCWLVAMGVATYPRSLPFTASAPRVPAAMVCFFVTGYKLLCSNDEYHCVVQIQRSQLTKNYRHFSFKVLKGSGLPRTSITGLAWTPLRSDASLILSYCADDSSRCFILTVKATSASA